MLWRDGERGTGAQLSPARAVWWGGITWANIYIISFYNTSNESLEYYKYETCTNELFSVDAAFSLNAQCESGIFAFCFSLLLPF